MTMTPGPGDPTDPPPPGPGSTNQEQRPNVRLHLRGGQIIETSFGIEGLAPGWPKVHYIRLDSVDAIEWLSTPEVTP